jgi:hypothetical protein
MIVIVQNRTIFKFPRTLHSLHGSINLDIDTAGAHHGLGPRGCISDTVLDALLLHFLVENAEVDGHVHLVTACNILKFRKNMVDPRPMIMNLRELRSITTEHIDRAIESSKLWVPYSRGSNKKDASLYNGLLAREFWVFPICDDYKQLGERFVNHWKLVVVHNPRGCMVVDGEGMWQMHDDVVVSSAVAANGEANIVVLDSLVTHRTASDYCFELVIAFMKSAVAHFFRLSGLNGSFVRPVFRVVNVHMCARFNFCVCLYDMCCSRHVLRLLSIHVQAIVIPPLCCRTARGSLPRATHAVYTASKPGGRCWS